MHPSQHRTARRRRKRRGEREKEKHMWRTRGDSIGARGHVRIRHSRSPSGNINATSNAPRRGQGEAGAVFVGWWQYISSLQAPIPLAPSRSTAFSSAPSLALPCLQAGLSQGAGPRAPARGQLRGDTQQAGQGKGPPRPSQSICSLLKRSSEWKWGQEAGWSPPRSCAPTPHRRIQEVPSSVLVGSPPLRPSRPTRTYLSKADPWLWLLVRREKTLRSLRGRVGGDEGGVNPTSGGLSQEGLEGHMTWEPLTWQLPGTPASLLTHLGHPASPCPSLRFSSSPAYLAACPRS